MTARSVWGGWPNIASEDNTACAVWASSEHANAPVANLRTDDRAFPWHSEDGAGDTSIAWSHPSEVVAIVMLEDIEASFGTKLQVDIFSGEKPGEAGTGDVASTGPLQVWQPYPAIVEPWGVFRWGVPSAARRLAWKPKYAWINLSSAGNLVRRRARSGRITFTGDNTALGYWGASKLTISDGWQPHRDYSLDWTRETVANGVKVDRRDGRSSGRTLGQLNKYRVKWDRIKEPDLEWLEAAQRVLGNFGTIAVFPRPDEPATFVKEAGSYTIETLFAQRGDEARRDGFPMVGAGDLELLEA